uniref:Transposase Tc1-like domain-containing protein n=1 Tax=Nothobranchius furzeri TaxID=105023 RepID=A0A8C6KF64_NOTFU
MPQKPQALTVRAIGMPTAGMSTISVACALNVHFSTISHLQRRFREYGSTSNRPHNRRQRVTTPAQDLHNQQVHLQDRLRPATQTAAETIGLHNQTMSAQTVRNHLRKAQLHACCPHRGLDLTPAHRRNRLEWGTAHIRWRLARWRGVLFTDESWFTLFRADGRQRVWRHVGERFADVNVVDQVAHGCGRVMVWAGICYGRRTQVHFINGILNTQRYRDENLRFIVVSYIHEHHLMFQQENARPHVATFCTQFLEAENVPVLAWPAYSQTYHPLSMFGMCLTGVYDSVYQFPLISNNFAQPLWATVAQELSSWWWLEGLVASVLGSLASVSAPQGSCSYIAAHPHQCVNVCVNG